MSKKNKYITISLDEETTTKATERAEEERRPLAQLLGLIIADHFNPSPRAEIAENLQIFRNGQKVNEIHATGAAAACELAKLFIWSNNEPRSVKIAEFINRDGLHELRGSYTFNHNENNYIYKYEFKGLAVENLPRLNY